MANSHGSQVLGTLLSAKPERNGSILPLLKPKFHTTHWLKNWYSCSSQTVRVQPWNITFPEESLPIAKHILIWFRTTWNLQPGPNITVLHICDMLLLHDLHTLIIKLQNCVLSAFHILHIRSILHVVIIVCLNSLRTWFSTDAEIKEIMHSWLHVSQEHFFFSSNPSISEVVGTMLKW